MKGNKKREQREQQQRRRKGLNFSENAVSENDLEVARRPIETTNGTVGPGGVHFGSEAFLAREKGRRRAWTGFLRRETLLAARRQKRRSGAHGRGDDDADLHLSSLSRPYLGPLQPQLNFTTSSPKRKRAARDVRADAFLFSSLLLFFCSSE